MRNLNYPKLKGPARVMRVIMACALCLSVLVPLMPRARAVGVSVSSVGATVGSTVNVTVTFSGTNIFGVDASFTYNSSVLKFVSGTNASDGVIVLSAGSTGLSSLSSTLTFEALAAGTSTVSVTCNDAQSMDADGNFSSLGTGSGSGTVTVTAAGGGGGGGGGGTATAAPRTPRPTAAPTAAPTATPPPALPVPDREIPFDIAGETLYIWHGIPEDFELPDGFEIVTIDFGGAQIEAAVHDVLGITLLYATDAEGENGALFLFLGEYEPIFPFILLSVPGGFLFLPLPEGVFPPDERYVETTVEINGIQVQAWQDPDGEPYLYLIYASYMNSAPGWYLYDSEQGTIQRYTSRVIEITPEPATPTPEPTPEPTPPPAEAPVEDEQPIMMRTDYIIIAGLVVLLIVTIIGIAITKAKSGKRD